MPKKKKGLTYTPQTARARAKEQRQLAQRLWGPVDTRINDKRVREIRHLQALIGTLTHQRDSALNELNDRANLENALVRLKTLRVGVIELAKALERTGQQLRRRYTAAIHGK